MNAYNKKLVEALGKDVDEIVIHLKLAREKLDKISENHAIGSRIEESICMTEELLMEVIQETNGIAVNFKFYLDGDQ